MSTLHMLCDRVKPTVGFPETSGHKIKARAPDYRERPAAAFTVHDTPR
jgi:hypothetical protein